MDAASEFRGAMGDRGIITQNIIPADGDLHRFHIEGDTRGSKNGWAVLHDDGIPAGAFGSWKHGVTHTWHREGPLSERDQQDCGEKGFHWMQCSHPCNIPWENNPL